MSELDDFLDDDSCAVMVVRKECSTALSPSNLPGLDFALNPYTRCGHGCVYCYAPYVMRVSPSEWTRGVQAKVNIPQVLAKELPRKKGVIGLGTVTDPYQPVEREMRLTRRCLEVMTRTPSHVSVLTKSDLVTRDIDLLGRIEKAEVGLSINTLSDEAASIFEPCAPPPSARLAAVSSLTSAGISTYVFLGPVIPTITDRGVEALIDAVKASGAHHVMVDRLNMRPGMRARMEETIARRSPERLNEFRERVSSEAHYSDIIGTVRRFCHDSGLTCQDAF